MWELQGQNKYEGFINWQNMASVLTGSSNTVELIQIDLEKNFSHMKNEH